jgi:hypothetical protein
MWWTCLCGVPGAWNTSRLSPYSTCSSAARQTTRRNVVMRSHSPFGPSRWAHRTQLVNWAESFIVAGTASGSGREGVAEHRQPAFGLLGGGLELQHVPVFDEHTVFQTHDVHGDPAGRQPGVG